MKKIACISFVIALLMGSISAIGQDIDPMSKGSSAISFGLGPGIPFYTASGLDQAWSSSMTIHFLKLVRGQFLSGDWWDSPFLGSATMQTTSLINYSTTNFGIAFRAAYHYGFDVKGLDCYGGFGLGTWFSFYNDADDYDNRNIILCRVFTLCISSEHPTISMISWALTASLDLISHMRRSE